jgi:hypothetical protein
LIASMGSSPRALEALHLAAALAEALILIAADRQFARAGKRQKANTVLIK